MMKKLLVPFTVFVIFCIGHINAQVVWSLHAGYSPSASVLSPSDYYADRFNASNTFSAGLLFSKYESVDWMTIKADEESGQEGGALDGGIRVFSFGLLYRQMNLQATNSITNFNFKSLEVPIDWTFHVPIFRSFKIGLQGGGFVNVPLQYKGTLADIPPYEYGNKKWEKPYVILGLKLGPTVAILTEKVHVTAFGVYNFSFIPLGKGKPENVVTDKDYDVPLPNTFEVGLRIGLAKP